MFTVTGTMKTMMMNLGLMHKLQYRAIETQRDLDQAIHGATILGLKDKFAVAWVYEKERSKSQLYSQCLKPSEVLLTLSRALEENKRERVTADELRRTIV